MNQFCFLLLAVVGLSQALRYSRTVSYDGEIVAKW